MNLIIPSDLLRNFEIDIFKPTFLPVFNRDSGFSRLKCHFKERILMLDVTPLCCIFFVCAAESVKKKKKIQVVKSGMREKERYKHHIILLSIRKHE